MKRALVLIAVVMMLVATIIPASARTNTPEQSVLPIPVGFCVSFSIPIGDIGIIDSFIYNSIWGNIQAIGILIFYDFTPGELFEGVLFVPSDTAFDLNSYDTGFDPYLIFDGLSGNFFTANGANLSIIDSQNCSFQVYKDNAALAQTYMVPNRGFDVYQIFQSEGASVGVVSFTVSIEDISGASAGDVLGSNEAGNIYFTYLGGGMCSTTYPYPDGKINSKSFVCWK
ncbi:MAG: hypothetical protein MUE54_13720 [Anaerolineae bacterium]|jgi:hypothetical protein|nr:hypothetical protein [Anaerolineae bacterium]